MAATVREYLVSLGAEVDQKSFNKFKAALQGSAMTVTKAVGVFAAFTAVLVKTSISLDNTAQKYEAMAKKAHKTTEEIQAQETALKILGKTLDEVKADKKLKEQYDNLVKLGKTMSLPQAQGGVTTLRNMVKTVNELRVVGTYAMQWINYYMLSRVRGPLEDLLKRLERFKTNVKNNMPSWASKVGKFFGDILRLAEAGAHGVADLIKVIDDLPDEIKDIGKALATAFALDKLGTAGLVIAALSTILILLDDFYTYKRGGKSAYTELWKSLENGTSVDYITEKLYGLLDGIRKFSEDLSEIIGNLDIGGLLGGAIEKGGNVISEILNYLFGDDTAKTKAEQEGLVNTLTISITNIVDSLNKALEGAMFRENGVKFGELLTNIFTKISSYFAPGQDGKTNIETLFGSTYETIKTACNGIMDFLLGTLAGVDFTAFGQQAGQVISTILNILTNGLSEGLKTVNGEEGEQGVLGKAISFVKALLNGITAALKEIPTSEFGETVGNFFNELFGSISNLFSTEAEDQAKNGSFLGAIEEAGKTVISKILDFLLGFATSIDASELGTNISDVVKNIFILITGAFTEEENATPAEGEESIGTKAGQLVTKILEKITEVLGSVDYAGIGEAAKTAAVALWGKIKDAFSTANSLGEDIIQSIVTGLTGMTDEDWTKAFGEDNVWVGAFATAFGLKLTGAGFGVSALGGILSAIAAADTSDQGLSKAYEDIKRIGSTIWTKITEGFSSLQEWWNGDDGKKFQDDLQNIGNDIVDFLLGKKGEDGSRSGGAVDFIKGIVESIKNNPAVKEISDYIRQSIIDAFVGLGDAIKPYLDDLWFTIVSNMPWYLKAAFGVEDFWKRSDNKNGTSTFESTDGQTKTLSNKVDEDTGFSPADVWEAYLQDPGYSMDKIMREVNKQHYGDKLDEAIKGGNTRLMEAILQGALGRLMNDPRTIDDYVYDSELTMGSPMINEFFRRNPDYTTKEYNEHRDKRTGSPIKPKSKADDASAKAAAADAVSTAQTYANQHPVEIKFDGGGTAEVGGKFAPGQAHGGFFGKPTVVTVGDDGDEAIIPMTNPSRAKGLIMQMFSRMGSSANDILASLGAVGGGGGSIGGPGMPASMQPAGMYPSAGGAITSNSGNTVSAPTTINVYGSGDPLAAGNAAAKASERNIVRRIRGCFEQ